MARPGARTSSAVCNHNPRPTYDDERLFDDDTYRFRIHYTTDTADDRAVTFADVERTAQILREVLNGVDHRGFPLPPDDTIDASLFCDNGLGGDGGNGYYDVYFVNDRNVYGYARPMSLVPGSPQSATSHLALSSWILDFSGALEVTVAHELFHSSQFVYDVYEDTFWMENTAVWIEDELYDDVNDYLNYVPEVFQNLDEPLDSASSIQYGLGLWPKYMGEQLGTDVVRHIWERCAQVPQGNALTAQQDVVDPLWDGGWAQAVLDFRGALYDRSQLEEGALYPTQLAPTTQTLTYPYTGQATVEHTAAHLNLFRSPNGLPTAPLTVEITPEQAATRAKAFTRGIDGSRAEVPLIKAGGAWRVTVEGLGATVQEVALIATHATTQHTRGDVTVRAWLGQAPETPTPGEPTATEQTPAPGVTPTAGGPTIPEESPSPDDPTATPIAATPSAPEPTASDPTPSSAATPTPTAAPPAPTRPPSTPIDEPDDHPGCDSLGSRSAPSGGSAPTAGLLLLASLALGCRRRR